MVPLVSFIECDMGHVFSVQVERPKSARRPVGRPLTLGALGSLILIIAFHRPSVLREPWFCPGANSMDLVGRSTNRIRYGDTRLRGHRLATAAAACRGLRVHPDTGAREQAAAFQSPVSRPPRCSATVPSGCVPGLAHALLA